MKRIILSISLFSVSFISFDQSHSKQEIIDWIADKLIKYVTEVSYTEVAAAHRANNSLVFESIIQVGDKEDRRIRTINLENSASYKIEDNHRLIISGKSLCTNKFLNSLFKNNIADAMSFEISFAMEENLKERIEKALNDLIAFLKKERQGKNEPY